MCSPTEDPGNKTGRDGPVRTPETSENQSLLNSGLEAQNKKVFIFTTKGMVFFYKMSLFSFLVFISGQELLHTD